MAKLERKIALVTGASSGIGQATAERLAGGGYKVYGTSRRRAHPGQRSFEMLTLDVTSDASVEAVVSEVMRLEGRIDLLVNNAGFSTAPAGAEESSIEQARSIFDTNFFGIVRMTRAVVPYMRRQGNGRIINIGSVLGFLPAPYMALYAATKHAIEGYSESLDHELRTRGLRVSVIEPAYTKTQFDTHLLEADSKLDEDPRSSCGRGQEATGVGRGCRPAGRRGGRRAASCHCGSPETPIHGRWACQPPAIAPQICARWCDGRWNSQRPAARHADHIAASHAGLGEVIDRVMPMTLKAIRL